jgi:hypothetical protein
MYLIFLILLIPAHGQEIDSVLVHPLFNHRYSCSEHAYGELSSPGDSLGADCVVYEFHKEQDRLWLKAYDGKFLGEKQKH